MSDATKPDGDQPDESQEGNTPAMPDFSEWQKQMSEEFDKRFRGVQSATDRRLDELMRTVSELKTSQMEPEEREQFEANSLAEERDRLKRENEILKMRKDFPDEVDFIQEFLGASSLEDQLKALSEFRKAQAIVSNEPPKGDEEPEADATPSSNNARREPSVSITGQMDQKQAEKLLGSDAAKEKGFFSKIRR